MKRLLIFLIGLGFLLVEYCTFAQERNIIYDGQFDFTWEFYTGSGSGDTARIISPAENGIFGKSSAKGKSVLKENDRILAINGTSFLRSEIEGPEIQDLEAGAASRTFEFKVYRNSMDSVLQVPVQKGTDITRKFPVQHVDYFTDSSGNLTLKDILRDSVQELFVKDAELKDMIYTASSVSQCIWIRLNIESRLSADRAYLLVFSASITDSISTYFRNPTGEYITQYAGMVYPEDLRGFVYKDWAAVKLNLTNSGMFTLYVRVCSDNLSNLRDSYFQSLEYLHENDRKERTIFALLGGMMVLIMFLCILIYMVTRARSYLLFFLFVTGYAVLAIAGSRYTGELDHTFPYTITRNFYALIRILPVTFFLLFSINYLEIRRKYERWYKLTITTVGLLVFSAAILIVGDMIYNDPGNNSIISLTSAINEITASYLAYLVLVVPSLRRIRRNDNRGWYVLLASLFFIVMAITQDYLYPGNSVQSLAFGLNSIDPGFALMNYVESAGIVVMFLIFALNPYRN